MHRAILKTSNRTLAEWIEDHPQKERKDLAILIGQNDDDRQIKRSRIYKAQSEATKVRALCEAYLKAENAAGFTKLFRVYRTLTELASRLSVDIKEAFACEALMK